VLKIESKRARLCLRLALGVATASASMAAQQRVRVAAVAVDATGAAVPGTSLTLVGPGGGAGAPLTRTANALGRFEVELVPGRYTAHVSHAGFRELDAELAVPAPATVTFVLTVAPGAESVEVRAGGFAAQDAATAGRMPMRLLDTPQQLDVLTGELLRSRGVESLKQAVEVVPAVGLQLGEGRRDNFYIRGFNAVSDMYIDGVKDDAQYYRDLSNTDHIEVLEGPAAVLYGRGSSGGLINRVTKKPSFAAGTGEGTLAELSYTAGSYGEQRGAADLDTVIPGTARKLGLRLTGAAEHEGSQRHFYWEDRYTFAPILAWRPNDATSLTAQVERLRDDRLPDRGIPYLPATGAPAVVPVGNFYGYVGPLTGSNFIHSGVTDGTIDAKHAFTDGWTIHATQRLAGYATNFANMYATNVTPIANSNGDYLVGRGEYNGTQNWRTWFTNVEAVRSGHWLGFAHTVLLGTEYGRESTDSTQYNGPTNQTPVDLLNPQPTAPVLSTVLSRNNRFLGQTEAVYAQDLITLSPRWKALLGLRFDNYKQALDLRPPTNTTANLGRVDNAASPRVGVVYALRTWASLYANYSRTFDPSGENLSLAVNNAQLKPEVTQNYEGGGKLNLLRERLLVTASVFRLDRTNIKTTDPNNPTALLNLGEQRTDGAELSVQGSPARHWQVYGGYAWLDGRIVSSTTSSNGVSLQGKRPAMSPLHAGSVWTTYSFARGFGFGGGLVAKDVQFASTDNLARLPAYARLDATVFYRRPRFELQANLQNLANARIWDAAQSDYQIYPAAPISGVATARWRF
jgi:catecholate siderophore receptor